MPVSWSGEALSTDAGAAEGVWESLTEEVAQRDVWDGRSILDESGKRGCSVRYLRVSCLTPSEVEKSANFELCGRVISTKSEKKGIEFKRNTHSHADEGEKKNQFHNPKARTY